MGQGRVLIDMAKDPAFLFYSDNFQSGTQFFSDEQTGKYIRLLCAQHLHGHLQEKHMLMICKSYDKDIWDKFIKDADGKYFQHRLELEISRRKMYSESRSSNRKGHFKKKNKQTKRKNISLSYDNHMGDGNEIENEVLKKKYIEWIEFRKNKGKPIHELASKKQVEFLKKYSIEDACKIIENSIMNDWQGLFELKTQTNKTNGTGTHRISKDFSGSL